MITNTQRQALGLFNDRVARLDRSSLAVRMANPNYTLENARVAKGEWISLDGVTEDAVDAFVLHVRLLTQDKDGFSVRRLARDVYSDASVPPVFKSRFDQLQAKWQEHRDQLSILHHPNEDRNLTNGELFDTLLYGGLAHCNANKVQLFGRLTRSGAFSAFVFGTFLGSLHVFLSVVRQVRDVNDELFAQWTR